MMEQAPMIFVKKFWSTYEPELQSTWVEENGKKREKMEPTGKLREVDWVAYGPVGSAQLLLTVEKISRLSAVQPMEGRAAQNPAVQMAHLRWNAIKPRYDAWKAGRAAPVDGTPLAAWNGVSTEQADHLRMHGIHTVEDVAKLTDTHRQRLGIPGLNDMIENAKRFLSSLDKSAVTKALEEKDQQIATMQAQIQELIEMVKEAKAPEPKRRGRPPKTEQVAA